MASTGTVVMRRSAEPAGHLPPRILLILGLAMEHLREAGASAAGAACAVPTPDRMERINAGAGGSACAVGRRTRC